MAQTEAAKKQRPDDTLIVAHPRHKKQHAVSRRAFEKVWQPKGYAEVSPEDVTVTETGAETSDSGGDTDAGTGTGKPRGGSK